MNQLVRQMKVWGLRADQRGPKQMEAYDETAASSSLGPDSVHMLELRQRQYVLKADDGRTHSSEVAMLDPPLPAFPTLSDVYPEPNHPHTGPAIIYDETTAPRTDGPDNLLTLTEGDRPRDSLSLLPLTPGGSQMQSTSSDRWETSSLKTFFTFSSHSSWSFGRVTGMPSTSMSHFAASQASSRYVEPSPRHLPEPAVGTEFHYMEREKSFFQPGRIFTLHRHDSAQGDQSNLYEDDSARTWLVIERTYWWVQVLAVIQHSRPLAFPDELSKRFFVMRDQDTPAPIDDAFSADIEVAWKPRQNPLDVCLLDLSRRQAFRYSRIGPVADKGSVCEQSMNVLRMVQINHLVLGLKA